MSACSDVCIDMDYDYDDNEFYSQDIVRARKPHVCCECGEPIPVGASYQRAAGKSDGRLWSVKTCQLCADIRGAFVCGGWIFGKLRYELEEVMFPIWDQSGPFDCLAKLDTVEARRKVNGWYDEWKL